MRFKASLTLPLAAYPLISFSLWLSQLHCSLPFTCWLLSHSPKPNFFCFLQCHKSWFFSCVQFLLKQNQFHTRSSINANSLIHIYFRGIVGLSRLFANLIYEFQFIINFFQAILLLFASAHKFTELVEWTGGDIVLPKSRRKFSAQFTITLKFEPSLARKNAINLLI